MAGPAGTATASVAWSVAASSAASAGRLPVVAISVVTPGLPAPMAEPVDPSEPGTYLHEHKHRSTHPRRKLTLLYPKLAPYPPNPALATRIRLKRNQNQNAAGITVGT